MNAATWQMFLTKGFKPAYFMTRGQQSVHKEIIRHYEIMTTNVYRVPGAVLSILHALSQFVLTSRRTPLVMQ